MYQRCECLLEEELLCSCAQLLCPRCPDVCRSLRSDVCRSRYVWPDLCAAGFALLRAGFVLQAEVQALPAEVPSAQAAEALPSEVLPPHELLHGRSDVLRSDGSCRSGLLCSCRSELLRSGRSDLCRPDELLPLILVQWL